MPEYPRSPFDKDGNSITPKVAGDTLDAIPIGSVTPAAGAFTTGNFSGLLTAKTGRSATLTVAANNSSASSKAQADYVCDGTADNVEIQAAIDALPASGGKVLLSEGNYNTTAAINIPSNTELWGSGWNSIITLSANTRDNIIQATNVTDVAVRYLHVNRDGANQTAATWGQGIRFSGVTRGQITNNKSVNTGVDGDTTAKRSVCIGVRDSCIDILISENYAEDSGHECISVRAGPTDGSGNSRISIIGNITRNADSGEGVQISYEVEASNIANSDITISGNVLGSDETGGQGITLHASLTARDKRITASGNWCSGFYVRHNDDLVISGNMIYNAIAGLYGTGVGIDIRDSHSVVIDGNIMNRSERDNLYFVNVTEAIVSDNIFTEGETTPDAGASSSGGMVLAENAVTIVTSQLINFRGNTVSYCKKNGLATQQCDYIIISDNIFYNNGAETNNAFNQITVTRKSPAIIGTHYSTIRNNLIVSNTTNQVANGIQTNYGIDNEISNNRIVGFVSSAIDIINDTTVKMYDKHSDLFMDVLAVSATHVRANEDLSEAIPNTFTIDAQPDVPRTLSGHFDAHAQITAYTIEITGVDAKGNTVTETITEADGWDWETSNAFATITSIIMTARTGTGAADTMDIGITDVIGLSNTIYATSDVFKIKKNNANATVATAQVNATYDTYDMSVITLGVGDDFTIWYKSNLNIIS